MTNQVNPWKTIKKRVIHKDPRISLYEDDVIKPTGEPGTYLYTESPPFVLIVGVDDDHFILSRQYRYPLHQVIVELPGGGIEPGETPLQAAKREFQEETGFTAEHWTKLGNFLNPNVATVFLAEALTQSGHNKMNEDGIQDYIRLTSAELDEVIARDELVDSKTLAALLLFEHHRR